MAREYKIITHNDRLNIEAMLLDNIPVSMIAKEIGCHRSAIYKEIKRGTDVSTGRYSAIVAQFALERPR